MDNPLATPPELLRVATAGSIDDGKSTLIGRLLHDTRSILDDQFDAVQLTSRERGDGRLDLALLTDGLRAEREHLRRRPAAGPMVVRPHDDAHHDY